ncbi:MAG: hypothetical protein U0869_13360 [Chloroflexota bacterium]
MQPDRGPLSRRALLAALVGGGAAIAGRAFTGVELASAAAPAVQLGVTNTGYGDTTVQNSAVTTTARGLWGRARGSGVAGTQTTSGNTGALGQATNGAFGQAFSSAGNGVRGVANNGPLAYGVWGSAQQGTGVVGQGPTGVAGASLGTDGTGVRGTANTGPGATGVAGASSQGFGVAGVGKVGVEGSVTGGTNYGRLGQATIAVHGVAGSSNGTGVQGVANTGALAFGVWGRSTSGYAGYFSGDVQVTGALNSTAAAFVVDHPANPAGQLLAQAYVASNEMLTTYSGNVTTDADGTAVVELPGYIHDLNDDFRYQLTVLGGFAQAVVGQKVRDGRFTIRTSEGGVEVSWQVTGVRADAFARKHPFQAERAKRGAMAGRLLRPDLHGRDAALDVTAVHRSTKARRGPLEVPATIDRKLRAEDAG